jgi:hypothetical protein
MANSLFCNNCGKKLLYEAVKPRCCGYCGAAIGSISVAATPKPTLAPAFARPVIAQKPKMFRTENEPEFPELDFSNMDGLELDIQVVKPQGESLASLASQPPENGPSNFKTIKKSSKRLNKVVPTSENVPDFLKSAGIGRQVLPEPPISEAPVD